MNHTPEINHENIMSPEVVSADEIIIAEWRKLAELETNSPEFKKALAKFENLAQ